MYYVFLVGGALTCGTQHLLQQPARRIRHSHLS
jgi:hypothetical protein